MSFNEAYSLEIVANMINSLNAKKVKILEPHSEKTLALIKRSSRIDDGILLTDYLKVYPDEGAAERYNANPMTDVIFKKKRNLSDGRIISIEPINPDVLHKTYKPIMVIDDLCDGGSTFKLIANYLNEVVPDQERNIVVTHMVNPKGIETLSANYDSVAFTNSYKDWENEDLPINVSVLKV